MNSAPVSDTAKRRAQPRKAHACNECKRRKIRCSGDNQCANCLRDGKVCQYSSMTSKVTALEKRLAIAECRVSLVERVWEQNFPGINLNEAIRSSCIGGDEVTTDVRALSPSQEPSVSLHDGCVSNEQCSQTSPAELNNAEQFEFDESREFNDNTDGMGSLIVEPSKAGYTGPQSGIAALKFLRSLPFCVPADSTNLLSNEAQDPHASPPASSSDVNLYINQFFEIYHPAYPLLHEGFFRARVAGALAKPRDGSWPILYNMVLAMGAFVGDTIGAKNDIALFRLAREHLTLDILEKGSLSYVQGLVIMANYLQKRNKPNAGFVLIGIAWSMAMGIGLHREFGPSSTTPFTMELRRRVWWTLFVVVTGSQLTLGRPAASLIGVNVRLPSNIDDVDLAVDLDELPPSKVESTVTTCLIYQVGLAKITNGVQIELLEHEIPRDDRAKHLDHSILAWRHELPSYFEEQHSDRIGARFPNRALLWRSFHLRIVLNRPLVFKTISSRLRLDGIQYSIGACLSTAAECVASICNFFETDSPPMRGLAWYATYWLITASFVQATCYVYDPHHDYAQAWRLDLQRSVQCLTKLGTVHTMALRARGILQQLLDHSNLLGSFRSPETTEPNIDPVKVFDWCQIRFSDELSSQILNTAQADTTHLAESGMTFPWYGQGSTDVEWLDAAGNIVLQGASHFHMNSNTTTSRTNV